MNGEFYLRCKGYCCWRSDTAVAACGGGALRWRARPCTGSLQQEETLLLHTYLLPALLGLVSAAGEAKNGEAHLRWRGCCLLGRGALCWCTGPCAGISEGAVTYTLLPALLCLVSSAGKAKNGEAHLRWKGCCGWS